ncbi:MSHA biogenesis protein MshK [Shewanella sp.]|uniref:MSHA biogenesis protein MshK n=1 Tax=Shewanella sp. TaxID=50422 RepID=UPI0035652F38
MWRIISLLCVFVGPVLAGQGLKDPTQPGNYSAPAAARGGSQLKSIITSPNGNYAVVGDKLLSIGDSIGSARIVAIGNDSIRLSDGKTLKLFQTITER